MDRSPQGSPRFGIGRRNKEVPVGIVAAADIYRRKVTVDTIGRTGTGINSNVRQSDGFVGRRINIQDGVVAGVIDTPLAASG